jgi:hypothetical protein
MTPQGLLAPAQGGRYRRVTLPGGCCHCRSPSTICAVVTGGEAARFLVVCTMTLWSMRPAPTIAACGR